MMVTMAMDNHPLLVPRLLIPGTLLSSTLVSIGKLTGYLGNE